MGFGNGHLISLEAELKPNQSLLYGLIAVCCGIELVLRLGDHGVIGPAYLRNLVYHYAAFWPGLLDNWKPNYAVQPYLMFLTYGFLHSGLGHLTVNMITLWSLGRAVLERVGPRGFAILYIVSILGGAIGFALLAPGPRPMVGASGSLFGLLGAIIAWEYRDRTRFGEGRWSIVWIVILLAVLNLVLWWAMNGQLAWQAHFGGFVIGWIAGLMIDNTEDADT